MARPDDHALHLRLVLDRARASHEQDDLSLGERLGNVTRDISTLMRQEVALAKAEVSESASRAGKGVGMLAGAAVAGFFVLMFLSICAVAGARQGDWATAGPP